MSARRRFALVLVGGILLSLSGMFLGLWWVTFATGVAIGLAGSWLGAAIRGVALNSPRSGAVEKLGDQRLEVKDPVLTQR